MSEKINEIKSELQELAPILAGLSKENLYMVPDAYFEEVEDQILNQIALKSIESNMISTVPEGYFARFESQLMNQIENIESESVGSKPIGQMGKIFYLKYAAAACVIFIVGFLFFLNYSNDKNVPLSNETATHEDYMQYMEDNLDDFDINVLIDLGLIDEDFIESITFADQNIEVDEDDVLMDSEINF